MAIRLTKNERKALEFLQLFSSELLAGRAVEYYLPDIKELKKMGIDINFIIHKKVKTLKKGKSDPFLWLITNAPWYIRGNYSKHFLPFQIKNYKNGN